MMLFRNSFSTKTTETLKNGINGNLTKKNFPSDSHLKTLNLEITVSYFSPVILLTEILAIYTNSMLNGSLVK